MIGIKCHLYGTDENSCDECDRCVELEIMWMENHPKRICFICRMTGFIQAGPMAGLPCPNNRKHYGEEEE